MCLGVFTAVRDFERISGVRYSFDKNLLISSESGHIDAKHNDTGTRERRPA
jgi:hypothetical protein